MAKSSAVKPPQKHDRSTSRALIAREQPVTRIKILASVVTFGIVALWGSAAFAGTITTPSGSPFNVPLNASNTGPAPFEIVATGYSQGTSVFVMICDGTSPAAIDWDPNINCDNGTSPQQQEAMPPNGTATWNPATSKNQDIIVFDGASPGDQFNCFYPGELDNGVAYSNGQLDTNDGLPSWTNCQIRTASTNGAVTADQAFATMVLPIPNASVGTTTTTPGAPTTAPATTTTTPSSTTTATTVPTTTPTTSTTTTTTTTTTTGTTTTTTVPGATGTTTTTVTGSSTTSTAVSGATTTSSTDPNGGLAVTGIDSDGLVLLGLCLVVVGIIAKSRGRASSQG